MAINRGLTYSSPLSMLIPASLGVPLETWEFLDHGRRIGREEGPLIRYGRIYGVVHTLYLALRDRQQEGGHLIERRSLLLELCDIDEYVRRLGELDDRHVVGVTVELGLDRCRDPLRRDHRGPTRARVGRVTVVRDQRQHPPALADLLVQDADQ